MHLKKSALKKYKTGDSKNTSTFSLAELAKFYSVSANYLLCRTENKNHPGTELNALRLGDDVTEVLKTSKFNHQPL